MLTMDYRLVDVLNSDQLEPDDLIGLGDEIVKVISVASLKNGYALTYENDFSEKDIIEIADEQKFDLYILE